jgi:tripartite-type tricarboxylate transporter receptor subunit TctC
MASSRSKSLLMIWVGLAWITAPQGASAVGCPTRQARCLVPMAAEDMLDTLARLMRQWLADHLGQPFLIEHRHGAATNIGTEAAVHNISRIAGRSPSYTIRQLYDFQVSNRSVNAALTKPVVDKLSADDMIALAGYATSPEL